VGGIGFADDALVPAWFLRESVGKIERILYEYSMSRHIWVYNPTSKERLGSKQVQRNRTYRLLT
jgi:hypothetical protein